MDIPGGGWIYRDVVGRDARRESLLVCKTNNILQSVGNSQACRLKSIGIKDSRGGKNSRESTQWLVGTKIVRSITI